MRAKPVVIEQNGTSFVTDKLFKQLFAKELSYNEETREIVVNELSTGAEKTRDIIVSSEFDLDGNTEGWGSMQNVGQLSTANGMLTGKIAAKMPILVKSNYNFKAADVKNIQICMQNNTNAEGVKIYFLTSGDKTWNEAKSMSGKIKNDGKLRTVDIDPSKCSAWSGDITNIRLDPGSNSDSGDFAIDYIRFEGDWKVVADASSMTVTEDEITWSFDANSTKDGWILSKQLGDLRIDNGILLARILGPSPKMYTIKDLDIDTSKIAEIEIKYRNATGGTKAKLQFLTDGNAQYDKAPSVEFEAVPNDAESRMYIIKTSDINGFTGKLNGICFMPTDGKGSVEIDYITLVTAAN